MMSMTMMVMVMVMDAAMTAVLHQLPTLHCCSL